MAIVHMVWRKLPERQCGYQCYKKCNPPTRYENDKGKYLKVKVTTSPLLTPVILLGLKKNGGPAPPTVMLKFAADTTEMRERRPATWTYILL